MALASTTATTSSPSHLLHRFSPPLQPSFSLPLAARRAARPRGYSRYAVRWEGRTLAPRALLRGFSDAADTSESDDDVHGALRGGHQPPQENEGVLELAAASSGPERWDVLGLGQAI